MGEVMNKLTLFVIGLLGLGAMACLRLDDEPQRELATPEPDTRKHVAAAELVSPPPLELRVSGGDTPSVRSPDEREGITVEPYRPIPPLEARLEEERPPTNPLVALGADGRPTVASAMAMTRNLVAEWVTPTGAMLDAQEMDFLAREVRDGWGLRDQE